MNKTLLLPSRFLTRIFLIVTICALFCATSIQSVQADAAPPPDPTVSGVGPYQPQKTNVQMMSETVLIEMPAANPTPRGSELIAWSSEQISVSASFTMKNQGQVEEKMQVIFPLTRLDLPWLTGSYDIIPSSFVAKVNSQPVSITEISTPPEITVPSDGDPSPPEGSYCSTVRWAAFEATFPVHQNVLLEVDYNMGGSDGFTGIEYILETGAGWYGNILSADITLRLPYPATPEVVQNASPGYIFSGSEIRWNIKNFEPTRKDNLSVRVINSHNWQPIIELRSKVEQNPNDADSWYRLGDEYSRLALRFSFSHANSEPYSISNRHFADLSVEAYEKAITLRPDWGDAHFKLAKILWFGNENVEKRFNRGGDKNNIQSGDPSIQRVLQELQLAWSYGITGSVDNWEVPRIVTYINSAIPSLELTPPATATTTPGPPTESYTSTPTVLVLPMDTPTLTPLATPPPPAPTKASLPTTYSGLVVGLLIVVGMLVYLWRSKFGGMR